MRKLVLFMHVSLDGFTAGLNGEMNWINVDDEIFHYSEQRTIESDTALYGRVTYELMQSYWPTAADNPAASRHDIQHAAWYSKVAKVVISKTMQGQNIPNTTILSDNISAGIASLKQEEGKEIIIFGSPGASHTLMAENLIDELWLFVNPVLLGEGIPLFKNIKDKTSLTLKTTKAFASGVVCLNYSKDH